MSYEDEARRFVDEEKQFQLGLLTTERSHPVTRDLSSTIARSTVDGVRQLFEVDLDIVTEAPRFLASNEHRRLVDALTTAARDGRTIVFSGCGSTGRLAVLLESIWRRFWNEAQAAGITAPTASIASRVRGIITGGDRALIRSVESFEDYEEFGREQVRELALERDDLFVAISEGGETSSVIGTARQAIEDGCIVFFVFNNPRDLLVGNIERSRRLIEHPDVTIADLTTGPMALSGSTRMQATTAELLFVATAMEEAISRLVALDELEAFGVPARTRDWSAEFAAVRSALAESCADELASLVEFEASRYRAGEMVAYAADRYLLDIFADTTERTPTFSIPPFRRVDDSPQTPDPWAIAFNPSCASGAAWQELLGRAPMGLHWDAQTYRRLGVESIARVCPALDEVEIGRYPVGTDALALYGKAITAILEIKRDDGGLRVRERGGRDWYFALPMERTALDVMEHLAVKLVFNTLSTATMALLGRIHGNWMIQVSPTNKKLVDRSIRIIADLTQTDYAIAARTFFREVEARGAATPSMVEEIVRSARRPIDD